MFCHTGPPCSRQKNEAVIVDEIFKEFADRKGSRYNPIMGKDDIDAGAMSEELTF